MARTDESGYLADTPPRIKATRYRWPRHYVRTSRFRCGDCLPPQKVFRSPRQLTSRSFQESRASPVAKNRSTRNHPAAWLEVVRAGKLAPTIRLPNHELVLLDIPRVEVCLLAVTVKENL